MLQPYSVEDGSLCRSNVPLLEIDYTLPFPENTEAINLAFSETIEKYKRLKRYLDQAVLGPIETKLLIHYTGSFSMCAFCNIKNALHGEGNCYIFCPVRDICRGTGESTEYVDMRYILRDSIYPSKKKLLEAVDKLIIRLKRRQKNG